MLTHFKAVKQKTVRVRELELNASSKDDRWLFGSCVYSRFGVVPTLNVGSFINW